MMGILKRKIILAIQVNVFRNENGYNENLLGRSVFKNSFSILTSR